MKSLKIDVLCNDGSPLGISTKTIWGDKYQVGVGGAELALLTMCEIWNNAGHKVTLYNNPLELGMSPFEQQHISEFKPEASRDILIVFRSPNKLAIDAKGHKIWWSCDQNTVGNFAEFAPHMNKIVCISPYHAKFFADTYQIRDVTVIDLPVRVDDYGSQGMDVDKIPNRLIFTSIADRGLMGLCDVWDKMKSQILDLSVVITSDYRLWGRHNLPTNEKHRAKWMSKQGVTFLGAVPRKKLIEIELQGQIFAYPCTYPELFCISVAEAQYAGVVTITSSVGALLSTNMGIQIEGNPQDQVFLERFSDEIIGLLKNKDRLKEIQQTSKSLASTRFHPSIISHHWNKLFEEAI
jgi:glycosyltransferase involved in cell wall biosynthesis